MGNEVRRQMGGRGVYEYVGGRGRRITRRRKWIVYSTTAKKVRGRILGRHFEKLMLINRCITISFVTLSISINFETLTSKT